ncbi:MAG: endonuclease/exonuclease/phosphatase family protein [Bacteroidota bacterium]
MKNNIRIIKQLTVFAIFLISISIVSPHKSFSQAKEKQEKEFIVSAVGFYNVENLFDTINDPDKRDEEFTPEGQNRWNTEKYLQKLTNLSEVIEKIGQDYIADGVAVLGVSEIENRAVLEDLANTERLRKRNYQVVHYEGPDRRSVDVAFLYNPKYFKYISSKPYPTIIEGKDDFKTRDQLLLTGELLGERMHFIVAHWPSRAGGEKRSRPLRNAAADIAKSIIDSIIEVEPDAKIFMMGDLNDDPDNKSVEEHLNAKGKVKGLKEDELYNPFYDMYKKGIGSNAYRDSWSLFDQIIVSPTLVKEDYSTFQYWRAEVFNRPFLIQSSGRFEGYPYRTFGGGVYLGGYSDHYPSIVYLIREKQ